SLWIKFRALGHYTLIAGGGFLIDLILFLLFVHGFSVMPFWASMIGMLCAASFVYAFATRRIFTAGTGFRWHKWAIYIAYVLVTMFIWSGIIASLIAFGLWPVLAKFAILPLTFYTNFLFMGWLQEGRIRWY
ncbi:MAG TPA: GtrA family protein, partial [Alphaproteobacteria bacterium]|nr:GtrA family protein [Alphaproteobacteria bacterium]